ncbi:MAG: hypothetical protein KBB88_02335, partial [Candidatus Pacebacteria bacterium]|nr:hypothetical protein [Candidatus Paceibacterota bacterium]
MFKNNKIFAFICTSIFITIIYFSLPTLTHAQNIVVNSLLDDGDGTCTTKCTFTDAINTSSDGDEITFSVTGTIVLDGEHSRGLDHDLTITGPGIEELTLDMNAGPDAILEQDDGDFEISNLTITNGADTLVVSYGSLTISDVLFIENSASTLLDLEGLSANLNNVSFIENTTQNYTIYSCGDYLNITNSTFSGYTTASISRYILEDGCSTEINIANSTFFNNSSKIQAVNSYNDISITNSTFYSSNENAPIQITSDNDSVSITITNSVLYSTADNNCGVEIVSLGNNIETGSSCRFNHTDDITNPAHYLMLHEFDGTTGSYPYGSLVESNGVFYGMTNTGGTDGVGVIFSYDPSNTGSEYDVLYEFDDTTGSYPYGSLVESNGVFYGMTNTGGTDDAGVIFSYDPSNTGSEYDVLYEFDDTTGSYPYGSLVESNGVLYGMTNNGGTDDAGVIFSYDPSNTGSEYDMLYEFDDTTGSYPYGSLVESNGVLYGMTNNGGTDDAGVIFSY